MSDQKNSRLCPACGKSMIRKTVTNYDSQICEKFVCPDREGCATETIPVVIGDGVILTDKPPNFTDKFKCRQCGDDIDEATTFSLFCKGCLSVK